MTESSCVEFLQWALPRLALAWPGFRRVRRQVCRRIGRRAQDLKLPDLFAYRAYLEAHREEWALLDSFCRIPISRLLRDRIVFDRLGTQVLPELAAAATARGERTLRFWSAGCASGEEPYSLKILWTLELASRFPNLSLAVIATDIDEGLLERARAARYRASSLRELPGAWVEKAFARSDGLFELRPEFRAGVEFLQSGRPRRDAARALRLDSLPEPRLHVLQRVLAAKDARTDSARARPGRRAGHRPARKVAAKARRASPAGTRGSRSTERPAGGENELSLKRPPPG